MGIQGPDYIGQGIHHFLRAFADYGHQGFAPLSIRLYFFQGKTGIDVDPAEGGTQVIVEVSCNRIPEFELLPELSQLKGI
jgi:hypothetical protein